MHFREGARSRCRSHLRPKSPTLTVYPEGAVGSRFSSTLLGLRSGTWGGRGRARGGRC